MLEYKGKFWQIPPDGTPWEIEATKQWGAGVDEHGIVRQIGVVPKPLQKPHPPIFQPFASSEDTIRWCAREHVTAILPPMYLGDAEPAVRGLPGRGAARSAATLAPGEGLGVLRDVVVADTDEEALELWHQTRRVLRRGLVRAVRLLARLHRARAGRRCSRRRS